MRANTFFTSTKRDALYTYIDCLHAHTLKPRDFLRPRAFSNLRPFERTCGAVVELGTPGAFPKWRSASRAFTGPRSKTVPWPKGDRRASLSKVRHSPPTFAIRARAVSVKRTH